MPDRRKSGRPPALLEYALWEYATAMVYRRDPGRLTVCVEYRDPSPSQTRVKLMVGEFSGKEGKDVGAFDVFDEKLDELDELKKSCGAEIWEGFMEELQRVFAMVQVMDS